MSFSPKVVQFVLSHGQTQVLTGYHLSLVGISLEEGKCFDHMEVYVVKSSITICCCGIEL